MKPLISTKQTDLDLLLFFDCPANHCTPKASVFNIIGQNDFMGLCRSALLQSIIIVARTHWLNANVIGNRCFSVVTVTDDGLIAHSAVRL